MLSQPVMTSGAVVICGEFLHNAEEHRDCFGCHELAGGCQVEHISQIPGLEKLFMSKLVIRSASSCFPLRKRVRYLSYWTSGPECWVQLIVVMYPQIVPKIPASHSKIDISGARIYCGRHWGCCCCLAIAMYMKGGVLGLLARNAKFGYFTPHNILLFILAPCLSNTFYKSTKFSTHFDYPLVFMSPLKFVKSLLLFFAFDFVTQTKIFLLLLFTVRNLC